MADFMQDRVDEFSRIVIPVKILSENLYAGDPPRGVDVACAIYLIGCLPSVSRVVYADLVYVRYFREVRTTAVLFWQLSQDSLYILIGYNATLLEACNGRQNQLTWYLKM